MQHIVLDHVSWELYEHLLREIGNRPIRLTYDQGTLEIMSPLSEHESAKKTIARLLEILSVDLEIPIEALGSTTFRLRRKQRGLEPDECYYVRSLPLIRGKRSISLPKDPPPDLAIEIDISSHSLERLPIYAALGVPEVWRFDGSKLSCMLLSGDGEYRPSATSASFPMLRPSGLTRFLRIAQRKGQSEALEAFRQWVRKQGWTRPK